MSEIGNIKAHLVAESSEWVKGLSEGGKALDRFEKANMRALKQIARAQKAAAAEAKKNAQERAADMAAIGQAAQNVAGKITAFTSAIADSAAVADDLTDSLAGAFGDRASDMSATIQKLGTGLQVFGDQQVASASKSLEKFGIATEQNLTRVVDLAAKTGTSVDSLAESFGKFEKFGDSKAVLALQKAVGASGADLEAFGAKLDAAGKVMTDTPARLEAARTAMTAFIDQSKGAALAMSDESSRLAGSMELLRREVGESGHAFKEGFAPYLLQAVDGLRGLSPEVKGAAGLFLTFSGYAVSAGGSALQMGTNISILTQNTTLMAGATKIAAAAQATMATALGASLGIVGLLAIAMAAYIVKTDMASAALEKQIAMEEKRKGAFKSVTDKTGNVIPGKAKKASDLDAPIQEATARLKQVQGDGSTVWNPKTNRFDKINDGGRDAINKASSRLAGLKSEQNRLRQSEAAGNGPAGDVNAPSKKEQAALDKDAAKKAAKAEKDRKGELSREIAVINQGLAAKKISAEQAIQQLEQVKSEHAKTADERVAIDSRIATLTGQIESKKTADQKKEESNRTAELKKAEHAREAEIKKAERERKSAAAKSQRELAAQEKKALAAQKKEQVQHAKDTAAETKAAAKSEGSDYVPFGATLSTFGGGPVQGSIEERRQATAAADKARRDTAMASSAGTALNMGRGVSRAVGKSLRAASWLDGLIAAGDPKIKSTGKSMSSTGSTIMPPEPGSKLGDEIRAAFEDTPIVINNFVNSKPVGSLRGSAGELSRAAGVQNANVPLGKA